MTHVAWIIPLFPLAAFAAVMFWGERLPGRGAYVSIAGIVLAAVAGIAVLFEVLGGARADLTYPWAVLGARPLVVGFVVDPLAAVMLAMVGVVASLITIYSVGYMHGDPRFPRFFAYLSLFQFSMLFLVLADNFLFMYAGWELVGLCSYLLIGFWFERPAAARAALKAFVTTRVGDFSMMIGILILFLHTGTLSFTGVFHGIAAGRLGGPLLTLAAVLVFGGAVGKSAQLPLHVWLPDAMEGPTPVSALIHAATMVTAGVYLVVRAHPIFEQSHIALTVVAVVGVVTAIYAGFSAFGQDDIKRMLAYSTISQLGFMFFGAGMGAYSAAIFLLVAHAFFKALLFLAAGSVMHALPDEETDMVRMGGLRKVMPLTAATWVVGWLAMAGIPPLSGFFAK